MIKKRVKWPWLMFFFMSLAVVSYGQQITVSGTVTDAADGTTLIGVSVIEKGTTNGTTTDIDGNYSITVEQETILVFTYIGYNNVEIIAMQETMDVALEAKSELLEEIIVIGYGTQKKTDKTGAVSHVTAEELNQGNLTDPIQGLQGKAAGVSITKKGGDPNAGFAVRIRGSSGMDSNTQPLFVIDGVPGADPTIIAPEDIESYNVLKDAASTAIYGSRGANGVIIITTKKAKSRDGSAVSQVNFNSKFTLDRVANTIDVLSADELRDFADVKLQDALIDNPNFTIDSIFTDGGANTNWQDEIFRTGITTENNLSFSGGSQKSTYLASITHANWQGVMKGTEKERTTARINLTHKALNDRLTLSGNLTTSFENNDYENYGGWNKDDIIYQAISRNPTDPVYNADGSYNKTQREFNYENPIATINEITNIRDAKKYLGNLRADVDILEGLTGSLSVSYLRSDQEYTYFRPKGVYASADEGFGRKSYDNSSDKILEGTLNYIKSINDKHNLNVLAGYSWQESNYNGFYSQASNSQSPFIGANDLRTFVDVSYGDVGSYKGMWRLIGFFARAEYNYDSKYYIKASIRRDGSTKFGENNRWGWFPTAALGWNMHNENFMRDIHWLDQLKLRASYGVSGNQEIGVGRSQILWQPESELGVNPETGQSVVTYEPAWNDNPDLKWESTTEINFGIDFAFFQSKLSGSIEYYMKNTDDLLGAYSVPVPPNLARTTYANSGSIENNGIELYIQAFVIDNSNFTYKTSLTFARNKSEWTNLGEYTTTEEGVRQEGYISGRGMVGEQYFVTGIAVGQEVGAFYLPEFVQMLDNQFVYISKSGGYTTELVDAKRTFIGTPNPDFELGWSNSFTFFKNWNLDFALRSMIGNKKYNATKMFFDFPGNLPTLNGMQEAIDWYQEGRFGEGVTGATIADFYLEDASFLKMDYISIGYTFNTTRIDWLNNFKLFVVANNVFTITNYTGADPETYMDGLAYGIDQYNVYPKTQSITFGLNVTF
jgi:TonB-linked SusC/RagA family outer membrane protein